LADRPRGRRRRTQRRHARADSGRAGHPAELAAYFAVESVDEALTKAQELGGGIMFGPLEVPTGKFAALHDPQRAVFAVFEGQFDD
jgi:uncharacterized protein